MLGRLKKTELASGTLQMVPADTNDTLLCQLHDATCVVFDMQSCPLDMQYMPCSASGNACKPQMKGGHKKGDCIEA